MITLRLCDVTVFFTAIFITCEANGKITENNQKNGITQKINYTCGLQNIDLTAANDGRLNQSTIDKFRTILRSTFTVEKSVLLTWTDTMNFNIEISQWLHNISIPIQIKDEFSMSHYNDALDYKLIDDYGIDNTIDGFIILTNKIKYVERLISTILIKLKLTSWDNRNKLLIIYFDYFHCYISQSRMMKYNKQLNSIWRAYRIVNILLQVVYVSELCPRNYHIKYANFSQNWANVGKNFGNNSIAVNTNDLSKIDPNEHANNNPMYKSNNISDNQSNFIEKYNYMDSFIENETIITSVQIFGHNPFALSGNNKEFNRTGEMVLLNDENRLNVYLTKRLYNLNGYPLTVSLFYEGIKSNEINLNNISEDLLLKKLVHKNGDRTILRDLSTFLNFSVVLKKPSDNETFGTCKNQMCSGSIKDIVDRVADLSFNRRFLKWYGVNTIEYSIPIATDRLCVLVRQKGKITGIRLISIVYSTEVFCFLAIVMLITVLFDRAMHYANKKYFNRNTNTHAVDPIKAIIGAPIVKNKNFKDNGNRCTRKKDLLAVRLLIGCCLLFGIVFNSLTQGIMYQTVRVSRKQPNIDTLAQLRDSEDVKEILISYPDLKDTFNGPESRGLKNKLRLVNKTEKDLPILLKLKNNKKAGVLVRKTEFENMRLISNHSKDYYESTHLVKECPRNYYLSYILPHGSYLTEPVNYFLSRVAEGGLRKYYQILYIINEKKNYQRIITGMKKLSEKAELPENVQPVLNKKLKSDKDGKPKDFNSEKPFTLEDLYLAFYIWMYGLMFSSIVFIIEIVVHKRKTKVRP